MASADLTATGKVRSRKDGAAVPLDEFDKQAARRDAGLVPDRAAPVRRGRRRARRAGGRRPAPRPGACIDDRIIRQVTPIYDTRALRLRLDARRREGRPRAPVARGEDHQLASRRLATTTCATTTSTCGSRSPSRRTPSSGSQGTLDVLQERTGAESIRQLPTLKLFKIRMDLEMAGDTQSPRRPSVAEDPVDLEQAALRRVRHGGRARDAGRPAGRVRALRGRRRAELGVTGAALLEHLAGMQERGLLRRVAAILFHRRAGFSANGMGVWQVPDDRIAEVGPRMAAFRGISPLLPAPDLRGLAVLGLHDGPRPLQGGVRRDPRRDRRRVRLHRRPRDALLAPPSSRRSASCTSPTTSRTGSASSRGV